MRYHEDAELLAAIGTAIGEHRITVRLPRALAEAAVAAWQRDETGPVEPESPEQWVLRDRAAELALIGLAVSERGRAEGDFVVVDLDVAAAGAAVRAARE